MNKIDMSLFIVYMYNQRDYLTEIDQYIDIVLTVYMFWSKSFSWVMWEDNKNGDSQGGVKNKQTNKLIDK